VGSSCTDRSTGRSEFEASLGQKKSLIFINEVHNKTQEIFKKFIPKNVNTEKILT
jgi:hypothetical protein